MFIYKKKNQTGKSYYYLGENKSIKGVTVRAKEIYLGTADNILQRINSKLDLEKINTYEYGLTVSLLQQIRESGLYQTLNDILPFNVRGVPASIAVIIILINKIIDPQSKNSINKWYNQSVLSKLIPIESSKLTGQFFFDCIRGLNQKRIQKIEQKMAKNIKIIEDMDSILCDMTHIETYIQEHEGNILPQRGRTRTKTGRRIVNLALMITRKNSIPLFHLPYPGHINDYTEFAEVVKILEKKYSFLTGNGKKKVTIMIDKGNNTEENINGLEDAKYYFVGRLKPSNFPELINKPIREFKDKYNNDTCSYSIFKDIYGRKRKIVIKFSKKSFDKSYEEFMDLIERRKNQIKSLENNINFKLIYGKNNSKLFWQKKENIESAIKRILNKKPTKKLFNYILTQDNLKINIKIGINQNEYEKRINFIGKYILFTNRKKWSSDKIIKAFLDQYLIEDQYKTLKSDRIKMCPLNHWTDESIRADIYLSVLSLQLMNLFLMKIKNKGIDFSNNKILDTLEQIKVSYYKLKNSEYEFDILNETNEDKKLLLDKLNLQNKNTFSYLKRAF
jgi:transposase